MEEELISAWSAKLRLLAGPRSIGLPDTSLGSLLRAHTQLLPPEPQLKTSGQGEESGEEPSTEPSESGASSAWRQQLAAHLAWKSLQDSVLQEINPFYGFPAHQPSQCAQCCSFAADRQQYEQAYRRHVNHQKFVADKEFLADLATFFLTLDT